MAGFGCVNVKFLLQSLQLSMADPERLGSSPGLLFNSLSCGCMLLPPEGVPGPVPPGRQEGCSRALFFF